MVAGTGVRVGIGGIRNVAFELADVRRRLRRGAKRERCSGAVFEVELRCRVGVDEVGLLCVLRLGRQGRVEVDERLAELPGYRRSGQDVFFRAPTDAAMVPRRTAS